jgi:cysteine desulfurase family protein (TIGR01976 family)
VIEIRAQFPALERQHRGRSVAYFDAPGGTQVPSAVAAAMTSYLFEHNANTHWAYPSSGESDAIILEARRACADFLNATPEEIVFGANMTTLTFHLARALGRTWSRGDEVITTELDHHANVAPWRALEREFGVVVRTAKMRVDDCQIDYDDLARLVTPKTKLIAVGGASNAVGTVNDVDRVRAIARDAGALLFVDAVHLAPHELLDVQRIGCDFLACSSYKFYGPHAGILFARSELLESLPFPRLDPAPQTGPERAETGTQNHEAIVGIGATIEFLEYLGSSVPRSSSADDLRGTPRNPEEPHVGTRRERLARAYRLLHDEGDRFARRLWDGLGAIRGVTLHGASPEHPRTPTIAFTVAGKTAEEVTRALVDDALFVSHGDFYAQTLVERLGVEALVRVGCACYTSEEEVERLIAGAKRIAET